MKNIIQEYGHILMACAVSVLVLACLSFVLSTQLSTTVPESNSLITNTNAEYINIPKPKIRINNENVKINVGDSFHNLTTPEVTASDERDGNLTSRITVYGTVNNRVEGTYKLRYVVYNAAGLKDVAYVKIIVER